MPCRMCDSPYHACKSRTSSSAGSVFDASDICFQHPRIARNLAVRAFREHRATREHGDGVAEVFDHAQVVLHHQHRAPERNLANQLDHAADILVCHPLRRLIEQHELGLRRKCRRQLERAFAPVRDRKSIRLNSSHSSISYAVFCLKKKKKTTYTTITCKPQDKETHGSIAHSRHCRLLDMSDLRASASPSLVSH